MTDLASRLFELLKASGWQTIMLAAAAGLLLFLSNKKYLPPLSDTVISATWIVMFICGALAAASIGAGLQGLAGHLWKRWQVRRARKAAEKQFRDYIPFLTDRERQILGYLLAKNQKTFVGDEDGGYAATLIARRFIQYIGVRGQTYDLDKCPLAVPDYIWNVMVEHKDQFPHTPVLSEGRSGSEVQPWRIPWTVR